MTVLVTGGAGYIGSVTVDCLLSRGEKVVVIDNLSRGHREALPVSIPFYEGDVGDRNLLRNILSEHKIDSCMHFAAFAYVGESMSDPKKYFENNAEQGIALLGSLLRAGVSQVVLSSSCATYGEPESLPITEAARQWPTNPYGWTKLILERALFSYDAAHGLRFVALRYFNAAGATEALGEDHRPETHLIANLLQTASGRLSELHAYGNTYPTPDGTAIRDYIHVSDLAAAHISALDYLREGKKSQCLNLGSGHGYSIMEVVERARTITGKPIPVKFAPPRLGDPARLIAAASKAYEVLGWNPQMSDLTTILRTAWNWHLRHPMGYDKVSRTRPEF